MAIGEEKRAGMREMSKLIKEKAKAKRELQEKTVRFYREYIINGDSDESARGQVLERLASEGLTERKLKKYIENPAAVSNPKALALSDAKIAVWLQKTMDDIDEVRSEVDDKLDELDDLESEDIVTLETFGKSFKGKPVWAVKLDLMERKLRSLEPFYSAVKNLRGNTPLLNINMGSGSHVTIEELTHEIDQLKKQQGIEDADLTEV